MSSHQPLMTPKLGRVLNRTNGNMSVDVTGPINWNIPTPPAGASAPGVPAAFSEIAVWFTVVVSQVVMVGPDPELVTAIGGGTAAYFPGTATWWATATVVPQPLGPTTLEAGGATVAAWASIAHDDGGYASYEWTLPVLLR